MVAWSSIGACHHVNVKVLETFAKRLTKPNSIQLAPKAKLLPKTRGWCRARQNKQLHAVLV